ncbi:hypothetical protein JTE90_019492 [Oedothorax gibbosus]|uniref:ZZ-type domain-containing protein n=1 Tax=Oedothorax gibbosus TaxID=931172 RepID=A0AAV6UKN5_9ARAC|nr:hypothetical protein JTE90_019492 [Oedothorax gibbosus]
MASSTSNDMENLSNLPKDLETAPVWLQQYLLKMKQDIKKEVLDELLSSESSGEAHPLKIASSNKLHDLQDSIVHMGIYCDNCDQIIQGIRYKCVNCSDFDLCQECESLPYIHNAYHMFLKVRHPLPLRLKPVDEPTSGVRVYTKSKKAQTKKLYEARFIRDDTIPDSTVLAPSTQFVKSWRIMNSGTRVWNHNTKLQLIQGSADLTPTSDQVDVPHLRPGEVGVVSVVFKTPPLPGLYRSHWNFCHKSRPFGDIVWCHIIVHAEGAAPKVVLPPKEKTDSSSSNSEASCIEQVLSAVKKEHERGNMVPRKLVASSHTATPNNTPFDLSPPKSPDHHVTSVKELQNLTSNSKVSDNEDDVVSLGSSESDTEFVVIPMPKCFNMSESFLQSLQNIPQWAQEQDTADDINPESALTRSNPELQPTTTLQPVAIRRSATTSETVSQETGVPELSQNDYEQTTIRFIEEQNEGVKINYVSVVSDGSSSEISIIESEENSPVVENTGDQSVVNISVTSAPQDGTTGLGGVVNEVEEVQANEEVVDIPSNTFPKFPIEGITGTFDPSPVSNEERTVQVLPEGLVTGALSAAASVYNTAKAAINAMHTPRIEPGFIIPQSPASADPQSTLNPMDQLAEMGFCNRPQNEELLVKHNNDVALVVAELVSLNDNDWYESRHIPSSGPPAFD